MSSTTKPEKVYSVREITRLIKLQLENLFPYLCVEGEISDFKRAHSGHIYFTLKDETSQLHAVMWRATAQQVAFELENGLQVICRGALKVYEVRGQYQLMVEAVEPKGKGSLQLAFEQLKEKLRKEGLFDPEIKKKLPLLPKKIGIVTSSKGAAIIDIIRTLERRFAKLNILIFPVKVQGEGAAEEIVEGIDYLSRLTDIDVIIIGRGGGSIEDLWAFNEEKVARAIFRSPIPIISAVGHEIDFTIADFVADIRASTPSGAAEIVIDKKDSFIARIESLEDKMSHYLRYSVQDQKQTVMNLIHNHVFQNFKLRVLNLSQSVDDLETRVKDSIKNMQQQMSEVKSNAFLLEEKAANIMRCMLQNFMAKWEKLSMELHNLSPLNILKKGYTLCWKNGRKHLIRRIEEITKQEKVTVSFYRGEFTCLVEGIDKDKFIESRIKKQ